MKVMFINTYGNEIDMSNFYAILSSHCKDGMIKSAAHFRLIFCLEKASRSPVTFTLSRGYSTARFSEPHLELAKVKDGCRERERGV